MDQVKRETQCSFTSPWTLVNKSPQSEHCFDHTSDDDSLVIVSREDISSIGETQSSDSGRPTMSKIFAPSVAIRCINLQALDEVYGRVEVTSKDGKHDQSQNGSGIPSTTQFEAVQASAAKSIDTRAPLDIGETSIADGLAILANGKILSEEQKYYYTSVLRRARRRHLGSQVLLNMKLLELILDHISWQDLRHLQLVTKDWYRITCRIFLAREALWNEHGIARDGSDFQRPCRGTCRWIQQIYADAGTRA